MTDTNDADFRIRLAQRISEDIDDYVIAKNESQDRRSHLGASTIGGECLRQAWYGFRWAGEALPPEAERPEGRSNWARVLRLFNRGHREEPRFVELLRAIGFEVHEFDTSKPQRADGSYPQFRIDGVSGHFGGSLDGIVIPPESYGLGRMPMLVEFKTNGTGHSFDKLLKDGVALAKPIHFAQMSTYGTDAQYGFEYGLYLNVCKNDDNLHIEIVKLDKKLGDQMRLRAEKIIGSQTPLPRISDNPTYFKCKYCEFHGKCHHDKPLPRNCRSCKNAVPVEGGRWSCELVGSIIPPDFIPKGCDQWETINRV